MTPPDKVDLDLGSRNVPSRLVPKRTISPRFLHSRFTYFTYTCEISMLLLCAADLPLLVCCMLLLSLHAPLISPALAKNKDYIIYYRL